MSLQHTYPCQPSVSVSLRSLHEEFYLPFQQLLLTGVALLALSSHGGKIVKDIFRLSLCPPRCPNISLYTWVLLSTVNSPEAHSNIGKLFDVALAADAMHS